ncbi:hypothetical protein OF83DRAFT_1157378 [Amylostereum chailletii]|nr:hypothetical protein OF83DRAFT_1157378 [Amylostereum chailletii]
MARILLAILTVLISTIAYRARYTIPTLLIRDPSLPSEYYHRGPASSHCTHVRAPNTAFSSCEDARFWDILDANGERAQRHVLLSCDAHRKGWNTVLGPLKDPAPRGSLWVYPVHRSNSSFAPAPRQVTLESYPAEHSFHPLGVAVTPARPGIPSTLLVVNHARTRSSLEQFVLSWDNDTDPDAPTNPPPRATWIRTLRSPYFVAPNSIALTSSAPLSFYLSNDHLFTRRIPYPLGSLLALAETYLGIPTSWVGHVTLARCRRRRTLAISSTSRAQILFYTRDPATHALSFHSRVHVPFAPDNLHFDNKGQLLVAGHPHAPAVATVAASVGGARAPSWVVMLKPRTDTEVADSEGFDLRAPVSASSKVPSPPNWAMETLYQTNGEGFMTATTALQSEDTDTLYVSGLYEDGLLACSL